MGLLDGSGGAGTTGTFKIQVGADSGMSVEVKIGTFTIGTNNAASLNTLYDLQGLTVSTLATAAHTFKIDDAFEDLNTKRQFGAAINRLTHAQTIF